MASDAPATGHAALDALPCGVLRIGADRKVLHANRYALDLIDRADGSGTVGRGVGEFVSRATGILLDSYVYPMLIETGEAEEVQLTLKGPRGESRAVVGNFSMNADGTVDWTFMGCVNRDKLYTELIDARDRLEDGAATLRGLNARIRERQSDLQAFCHSLSHDFSGPLAHIHRFVDVALEDLRDAGVDAPEELGLLGRARENAAVLIDMTDSLVEYLVADEAATRDEPVDLGEVVTAVLAIGVGRGPEPPTVNRGSLPVVRGNRAQLQMVFKNLLQNAVKYNERVPEITVEPVADAADGRVVVAVRDNGIGIAAADLDTVFDPFVRLDAASRYPGSGLGLSIVRRMVTNHGGEIRLESEPGVGSTFYLTLPRGAATDADPPSGTQACH